MISKQVKLLYILPWKLGIGGVQNFVVTMVNHFVDIFTVGLLYPDSTDNKWNINSNVKLYPIKNTPDAREAIDDFKPDIIHHNHLDGKWLVDYIKKLDCFLIGTHHIYDRPSSRHNSNYVFYGEQLNTIKHGINLKKFKPIKTPKNDRITIGIFGRLTTTKVPDDFIEFILLGKLDDYDIVFVGSAVNPEDKTIKDRLSLKCNISFIEDIPLENMPIAYGEVDLILIPTISDAGFVALEAIACGKPVVYRRTKGLPEVLGKVGLPFDTYDEMLSKVKSLADKGDSYNQISKLGINRVKKHYNLKNALNKYKNVYYNKMGIDIEKEKVKKLKGNLKVDTSKKNVFVFLTVHNRFNCTKECVEAIHNTSGNNVKIFLFENHSDVDKPKLLKAYFDWVNTGVISSLLINTKSSIGSTKWSKSLAFHQMMKMVELLPSKDKPDYLLMLDNDKIVKDGWLESCLAIIESKEAKQNNINVVSCWHHMGLGFKVHKIIKIKSLDVDILGKLGGAFWFARYDYWIKLGLPPLDFHDDSYFWDKVYELGDKFGVIKPLLVSHCQKDQYSARFQVKNRNYNEKEYGAYARKNGKAHSRIELLIDWVDDIKNNVDSFRKVLQNDNSYSFNVTEVSFLNSFLQWPRIKKVLSIDNKDIDNLFKKINRKNNTITNPCINKKIEGLKTSDLLNFKNASYDLVVINCSEIKVALIIKILSCVGHRGFGLLFNLSKPLLNKMQDYHKNKKLNLFTLDEYTKSESLLISDVNLDMLPAKFNVDKQVRVPIKNNNIEILGLRWRTK